MVKLWRKVSMGGGLKEGELVVLNVFGISGRN